MIDDARALTADLKRLVSELEDDIRRRAGEDPVTDERLRGEHEAARAAERTAASFEEWRDGEVTQTAVGWVLSTVFVRFVEDNRLIDDPLIGGVGDRLAAAKGRRDVYFDEHPAHSDRDHLQWCFRQLAAFPATAALFDEDHAAVWRLAPSADGAKAVREFFLRPDPQTGALIHDFTDPTHDTRFLGDLYQDLSEAAKKRYALLQTPEFVEEFILDRTLDPAITEFGLRTVRLIDPTCGSGHFLIGALRRLFAARQDLEPGRPPEQLVHAILEEQIFGVDLNPYATAIARFRLVIEALRLAGVGRLADAPPMALNLATGDSLLHGPISAVGRDGNLSGQLFEADVYRLGIEHAYAAEDAQALRRILGQGYHAVVGNPPYIAVQDAKLRDAYRARYRTIHGKYVLTVPFMERFFELARVFNEDAGTSDAGFVGKITGSSFMKREFGKALIERCLRGSDARTPVDVGTIIDSSGVDIAGHGTPTVVILGRARVPTTRTVRVLDGIRGEPPQPVGATPNSDAAGGLVWASITAQIDRVGSSDRFIRVTEVPRSEILVHPMTLGVGRDLKRLLEEQPKRLAGEAATIGVAAVTGEDDVYVGLGSSRISRGAATRAFVDGDAVRDYAIETSRQAIFPYTDDFVAAPGKAEISALWPWQAGLRTGVFFGKTPAERGMHWTEYAALISDRLRTPLSIVWAFVASNSHFALDRGGKVFKQSALLVKLHESATENDHHALLGVLNSSVVEFWTQQVCHNMGAGGGSSKGEKWNDFFQRNATKVGETPLPETRDAALPAELDRLSVERAALLSGLPDYSRDANLAADLDHLSAREDSITARMIFLQEELDWHVLHSFGLVPRDMVLRLAEHGALGVPRDFGIELGHRAFEVDLARRAAAGDVETEWFRRHGSVPATELPGGWPSAYRDVVARRIDLIQDDPKVATIEAPQHKRRWLREPWDRRERQALEVLILDRLEDFSTWGGAPRLQAASELTDVVRINALLAQAANRIAGRADADLGALVAKLLTESSVPFLAALRLKESGLRKRAVWERVWVQLRLEDRIDAEITAAGLMPEEAQRRKGTEVGRIDLPPKYNSGDFHHARIWRQRGKLDVPKERFFHVPGAERGADTSPVFGWAGWNERDRAVALAGRVYELREQEAADADRLTPLLAGVDELLSWIAQWFPDDDPDYGGPPADYFEGWLDQQLAELGLTRERLRAWRPEPARRGRRAAG